MLCIIPKLWEHIWVTKRTENYFYIKWWKISHSCVQTYERLHKTRISFWPSLSSTHTIVSHTYIFSHTHIFLAHTYILLIPTYILLTHSYIYIFTLTHIHSTYINFTYTHIFTLLYIVLRVHTVCHWLVLSTVSGCSMIINNNLYCSHIAFLLKKKKKRKVVTVKKQCCLVLGLVWTGLIESWLGWFLFHFFSSTRFIIARKATGLMLHSSALLCSSIKWGSMIKKTNVKSRGFLFSTRCDEFWSFQNSFDSF